MSNIKRLARRIWCRLGQHAGVCRGGAFRCDYCDYADPYEDVICGPSHNQRNRRMDGRNTSGFKGVSWSKRRHHWLAYISVNGKRIHLGQFKDKIDAARAYDSAALRYFGEYALTNEGLGLIQDGGDD